MQKRTLSLRAVLWRSNLPLAIQGDRHGAQGSLAMTQLVFALFILRENYCSVNLIVEQMKDVIAKEES